MSKDIKAIITYLDNYLTRTKQPNIDPVRANEILAKAGLLADSLHRRGKPLRDLLRKGYLPHAYQTGGKGSSWKIPHSNKKLSKIVTTKTVAIKVDRPTQKVKDIPVSKVQSAQLEKVLMNEKNFKSAASVDKIVTPNPGLYCIRITDHNKLPKPFNTLLKDREHNIIYIGIATESLHKRFLNQELRAKGHGTFFRSIGAALGFKPPKGSLLLKKNKRNYKFSKTDEQKIIKWINDNLVVNWVEFSGDLDTIENDLINKHRPLINLSKNPSVLKELLDLRKKCVQIANEL